MDEAQSIFVPKKADEVAGYNGLRAYLEGRVAGPHARQDPHARVHLYALSATPGDTVQDYLRQSAEVERMQKQIQDFLLQWIPVIEKDHRSYVTVAIGCTGGQHRSVFLVEQLAEAFKSRWLTLKRHRELDAL